MEALEVEPDPSAVTDGDDWDYHQGYASGSGAMNVRMISLPVVSDGYDKQPPEINSAILTVRQANYLKVDG